MARLLAAFGDGFVCVSASTRRAFRPSSAKPDDLKVLITIGKELGLYRTTLDPQKLVLP
jgi:hypothetical protein